MVNPHLSSRSLSGGLRDTYSILDQPSLSPYRDGGCINMLKVIRQKGGHGLAAEKDSMATNVIWSEDPNPLSFSYLLGFARRQRLTIIALVLLIGVSGALLVSLRQPQYISTALLVLDQGASNFVGKNAEFREHKVDTEVEMLRAMSIVERVAIRLKSNGANEVIAGASSSSEGAELTSEQSTPATSLIDEENRLFRSVSKLWEDFTSFIFPAPDAPRRDLAPSISGRNIPKLNSSRGTSSDEILALQKRFRIRRRGLTDVIAIEAKADTPERAAMLANLYAKVYLDEQVSSKLGSVGRVEAALSHRIQKLRTELSKADSTIKLRELLNDNLSRLNEVRGKRGLIMPDLRLAAPALPIERKAFPSPRVLMLLNWMLALGLALIIAFLCDRYFIMRGKLIEKDTANDL